jgi:hypothetical protein
VEVSPVNINHLSQTVAHPTQTFCLGECRTWDRFKDNVEDTLQMGLQVEINGVDTVFQLVHKNNVIIGGMPSFTWYFLHVGFTDN